MKVSQHAIKRMNERGIAPQEIVDVITKGTRLVNKHDSNKWTFVNTDKQLYAVCDKAMTTLITVFWKEV